MIAQMAYNLRSRSIAEELLEDDAESDGFEDDSSADEVDLVEEMLESESSESECSDDGWENATLEQRLLENRLCGNSEPHKPPGNRGRGRPQTKLRGTNNYVWDTRAPERNSGKFSSFSICW